MKDLINEFLVILKAFEEENVEYILIGGVAIILHGYARLTEDIDVFVKNTQNNIEKMKKALYSVFHDKSVFEISFKELEQYPVIRYGTPNGFYIDIVTNIGEMFSFDDLKYEIAEYRGVKIKLATPESLLKMKEDTLRMKDKIDAEFLKELLHK